MNKKTNSQPLKNKIGLFVLIGVCLVVAVMLSYKFYSDYRRVNTFDFDEVTPEGYFTDLETSSPEN